MNQDKPAIVDLAIAINSVIKNREGWVLGMVHFTLGQICLKQFLVSLICPSGTGCHLEMAMECGLDARRHGGNLFSL